jgi:hypothetical protein
MMKTISNRELNLFIAIDREIRKRGMEPKN